MIREAIENKVVLNFRMSDFRADRQAGNLPISGATLYPGLTTSETYKASGKSRLFVDLNDEVVLGYFPNYVGKNTQSLLTNVLSELVRVCPPKLDKAKGDRRAARADDYEGVTNPPATFDFDDEGIENQGEDDNDDWVDIDETDPDLRQDLIGLNDVDWSSKEVVSELKDELEGLAEEAQLASLHRSVLPPSSYYHSAGWFATGQEKKRPMTLSAQYRAAFKPRSRNAMTKFLIAKRELDTWIAHLVCIFHWSLGRALKVLRQLMRCLKGEVAVAVTKSWSSLFPCTAVGFNRTTRRHRDSKGFRFGLDAICVLGSFRNGPLVFPELGLNFEWVPGCLSLFDGYDLVHEVEEWEGLYRCTLISFCRSSSWRGLKLPLDVQPATLADMKTRLSDSIKDAKDAGEDVVSRQKQNPGRRRGDR
ncbi:hypothetical protein FS749_015827 [Ceratobasidium sp. UAMH 11750]|nr:hypothetical protein FS749_015827 [Ceratobasidium sp. UAMH 11750]